MPRALSFRPLPGSHLLRSRGRRHWGHHHHHTHVDCKTSPPLLLAFDKVPQPYRKRILHCSFGHRCFSAMTAGVQRPDQLKLPPNCSVSAACGLLASYFTIFGVSEPQESSRYLISHAMRTGYSLSQFEASANKNISDDAKKWLISAAAARVSGTPVQYIIGNWDFFGRQFECMRPVLIPRPETEELVERVLRWCLSEDSYGSSRSSSPPRRLRILDVGCGSGCIGISLLASGAETAGIEIEECVAIDVSEDAVKLANRNANNLLSPSLRRKYSVSRVSWRDFALNKANWEKFDLIVSNPPYITQQEATALQREVADFESPLALLGGTDGMVMIRDLLLLAPALCRRDTVAAKALWLETGEAHPELITSTLTKALEGEDSHGLVKCGDRLWDRLVSSSSDPLQGLPISDEAISVLKRDVNSFEEQRRFRVLSAVFAHETNTFCVVPTTLHSFERMTYVTDPIKLRANALKNPSALGASYEAANQLGWELVVPLEAVANPSGKLTDDAFETIVGQIVDAWDSSFDGALLHLHGAMVTESFEDAEGEILRRLRAKHDNPNVPIVVTLDLHGNITEQMATNASCLIAVRTYPHIDFYERGWQGARLLQRAMMGEVRLRTVIGARKPLLRGLDGGRTQKGPMRELIDRGCALEDANDVCVVSVCAGFSAADIHDIGPSVTVTVDVMQDETAALSRAQAVADEFTDYAWQQRAYSSVNHIDVPSAIALALEEQADRKHDHGPPLILAEVTDNPGSGHYGDAVNLLKAMVGSGDDEPGLSNAALYAIFDPEAVQAGIAIGEGNEGSITMGGRHDTSAGGEPLTLFGKVLRITDGTCSARGPMAAHVACSGPSMAFRCRGVDIAVISNNGQPYDVAQLEALGIDFKSKTTVALKSNHHFRASFEPLARRVVTVDGGGLGHTILFGGSYKHVRRPIWPLDDIPL